MKGKMMSGKSKVISTGKGVDPQKTKAMAAKKGGKAMPPEMLAKMKKKG